MYFKAPVRPEWSTWEWYHWIGLEKDINRYRFLIFWFHSWIFEKTSKFWAASCKNESNFLCSDHGLHRNLSSYWLAHFYLTKNLPKCCSILVWIAGCWNSLLRSHNPKNNWCLSRIFGARFGRKVCGLSTWKLWSKQAVGWIHFCMKRLRTLNSYQIFKIKTK